MVLSEAHQSAEELIHHQDWGAIRFGRLHSVAGARRDSNQHESTGNPYDNARGRTIMRTLKQEEVYVTNYRDMEDARSRTYEFPEQVYNRQRLHSALRYRTPEEFEQASELRGSDVLMETMENQQWFTTVPQ